MPHDQRTAFLEVGLWCREISRIRSDLSFHFMELKGKVRSTSTRSTTSVLLLVRRMHRTNPRRGERGIHQQSTQLMVLLVVIKKWQAGWFDKDQERSKKRDNAELPNNHGQRITQWFKVVTELFFTCSLLQCAAQSSYYLTVSYGHPSTLAQNHIYKKKW